MKMLHRLFLVTLAGLALVMQMPIGAQAFGTGAMAGVHDSQQVERERLRRVMDPATNVEEFRQELYAYFTEMEDAMRLFDAIPAVREKFDQAGFQPFGLLAETKQRLSELTPEELSLMRGIYARYPGWREASRSIHSFVKPELRQRVAMNSGSTRVAITPDNCADGIAADITNTDVAAAETVVIATDAIMEAFPTDGLTILLRLASITARALAKGAALALETLKGIKDDCTALDASAVQTIVTAGTDSVTNNDNANTTSILNSLTAAKNQIINNDNTNKTSIISNDNTNKASIVNNDNSNTTTITAAITSSQGAVISAGNSDTATILTNLTTATTTIVNNDNSNKALIVANDNANTTTVTTAITNAQTAIVNNSNANKNELKDLLLRTQIEADLAEGDSATPVAWYLTPDAKGGHLDLVQTIVTETLANILAAGGSVGNAQSFLDAANAAKVAGQFKTAYANYRKAYKAAAN